MSIVPSGRHVGRFPSVWYRCLSTALARWCWFRFGAGNKVTINAGSGRFGDRAGITRGQWNATAQFWSSLGYDVDAIPFESR
jgi:hypothetical protein